MLLLAKMVMISAGLLSRTGDEDMDFSFGSAQSRTRLFGSKCFLLFLWCVIFCIKVKSDEENIRNRT
jgi:hypothetical protein